MHIPDGMLNITTLAATSAVSAVGVAYAVKSVNKQLGEKQVPLMGVTAAFVFAAQMLNFPVLGGTSGHLIGAALAAIILGPWAGILVMTSVLLIQCLIFQDGGLLALGANIANMAVLAPLIGFYVYRWTTVLLGTNRRGMLIGGFIGAWSSVVLAAAACAIELAVSGASPLRLVLPSMIGWHAIIGIGEGLITVAALSLVLATRKDLVQLQKA